MRRVPVEPTGRRTRWILRSVLVALVVAAAVVVVGVASTVREARTTFDAVQTAARSARTALADGDTEQAASILQAAQDRVDALRDHTVRLDYRIARGLPIVGDTFELVARLGTLADRGVALGIGLTEDGGALVTDTLLGIDDGRVDLDLLQDAADALAATSADPLRQALDDVTVLEPRALPVSLQTGRDGAIAATRDLLDTLGDARSVLDVLPGFLGADGSRRYFLALQNQAEVRGTGGFLGQFAILEADEGRLELVDLHTVETDPADLPDDEADAGTTIDRLRPFLRPGDPVDRSDDFALRYDHVDAASISQNVNVDPDLPTTAEVLVRLYEDRTGEHIDGIVAITPLGLQTILAGTGPLAVPPELSAPDMAIPRRIPVADLTTTLLVDAYDVFGGSSNERREFQRALARAAFDRLLEGDHDATRLASRLADATRARQITLYAVDPDEQAAFLRVGVAGAMRPRGTDGDLLAVTANNAGADKSDVHVGRSLRVEMTLGTPQVTTAADRVAMLRHARVGVEVTSDLDPAAHDGYISGTTYRDPDGTRHREIDGVNRTWFTVWAPATTEFLSAVAGDGSPAGVRSTTIHGHRALDHYVDTPAGGHGGVEVEVAGPVSGRVTDDGDVTYELTWWHQPVATVDMVDLTIDPPPGWQVADVTLVSGPHLDGLGPFADAPPATVTTTSGQVRIEGAVTADLAVTIRLSRT